MDKKPSSSDKSDAPQTAFRRGLGETQDASSAPLNCSSFENAPLQTNPPLVGTGFPNLRQSPAGPAYGSGQRAYVDYSGNYVGVYQQRAGQPGGAQGYYMDPNILMPGYMPTQTQGRVQRPLAAACQYQAPNQAFPALRSVAQPFQQPINQAYQHPLIAQPYQQAITQAYQPHPNMQAYQQPIIQVYQSQPNMQVYQQPIAQSSSPQYSTQSYQQTNSSQYEWPGLLSCGLRPSPAPTSGSAPILRQFQPSYLLPHQKLTTSNLEGPIKRSMEIKARVMTWLNNVEDVPISAMEYQGRRGYDSDGKPGGKDDSSGSKWS